MHLQQSEHESEAAKSSRAWPAWVSHRARRDIFAGAAVMLGYVIMAIIVDIHEVIPGLAPMERRENLADEVFLGLAVACTLMLLFTLRRAAETRAVLRATERALALAKLSFTDAPLPMAVSDASTAEFLAVNDALVRQYGFSRQELLGGMGIPDLYPEAERPRVRTFLKSLTRAPQIVSRVTHQRRDGTLLTIDAARAHVLLEGRDAVLSIAIDVTEREALARAVHENEVRHAALFELAPIGLAEADSALVITRANAAFASMLGMDEAALIGRSFVDITHPDDRLLCVDLIEDVREGRRSSFAVDKRYLKDDGTEVPVHVTLAAIRGADGRAEKFLVVVADLSARDAAHRAHIQVAQRLDLTLDAIGEGLWDWNVLTDEVFFSPALSRMLGYEPEEFPGHRSSWTLRVHPDDIARVQEMLRAHMRGETDAYEAEHRLQCRDGRWLWILDRGRVISRDADGRVLRMVGTHTDISARRELEDQLRQAQKMEAVGQLAGGVAHDFNNLLTVIRTGLELALSESISDEARADLSEVEMATERAATLTSQLLAFSRRKTAQPRPMRLNDAVTDVTKLLHRVLPEDISVRHRFESTLTVMADPGHVGQALLNLALNARDAMPGGGVLTFTTRDATVDDEVAAAHDGIALGTYCVLTVADTGVGMTPEVRQRIFEPFFTTKAIGKGTGLGLSSVYGIVKQVGGFIRVESEPGRGSSFLLYFPVASRGSEDMLTGAPGLLPGGNEMVLVVEDEPAVRSVAARLLLSHGYRVREAANGSQALDILAAEPGVTCVLTDVVMPVMSGSALLAVMRERHPGIATVVMSAHAHEVLAQFPLPTNIEVLDKPFMASTLLVAVRNAIDAQQRVAILN